MFMSLKKRICTKICPKKRPREIVIVYPFNIKKNKIFLIQEYIHHYDRKVWKFVSGGVDKKNKDYATRAHEELAEEVAMKSDNFYHIHSSERIFGNRGSHFYVAEDPIILKNPPENPDKDIITDSKWVTKDQFEVMMNSRELMWDEATMCALQVFRESITNKKQQNA